MMGGQQPITESAYCRVDYVDGRFKDVERRFDAFREDYKKLYSAITDEDTKLRERLKNCETKIALQDAVISSLQTILSGMVANGNPQQNEQKPVLPKGEDSSNWIHPRDAGKICRSRYGMVFPHGEVSKALVWAGILERKSTTKDGVYCYTILEKNNEINLLHQSIYDKYSFLINPEKIEILAGILQDYHSWIENGRREI